MAPAFSQTLIVLPAFNEEETVANIVGEVFSVLPGVTCLVVDDGSRDRTFQRALDAGATVLRLPFNLGVGGAMRAGFRYALAHGFRAVVQVDADGQHDPRSVPPLLDALEEADLVLGARFSGAGNYAVKGPRKWAMRALSAIVSRIAGTSLNDTTSGLKASGYRAIRLFAEHYPAEYLGDTVEALVIAARSGCVIRQLPVEMRVRAGGVPSHNPVKSAVYLARVAVALSIALLRPQASFQVGTALP